jgi:hypothetical protein
MMQALTSSTVVLAAVAVLPPKTKKPPMVTQKTVNSGGLMTLSECLELFQSITHLRIPEFCDAINICPGLMSLDK